jgi:hypothetical protein
VIPLASSCERGYNFVQALPLGIASEGIDLGHALPRKFYGATTRPAAPLPTSADVLKGTLQTASLPKPFGTLNASGESEESHGVGLVPNRHFHEIPDAPPNAHDSDGSSSGTSVWQLCDDLCPALRSFPCRSIKLLSTIGSVCDPPN